MSWWKLAAVGEADATIEEASRARSAIFRAEARVSESGFSHSTCLPASMSPLTTSRCRLFAMTTLNTWMSGSSAMARQSVSLRS